MKILTISGSSPRHLYFVNSIHKKISITGAIIQKRENFSISPPAEIKEIDNKNFIKHFSSWNETEKKFFGEPELPKCNKLEVSEEELNNQKSVEFVKNVNPDIVLIFGSNLIKEPLITTLPKFSINLHLGISPRYRGAATLFWPFYFMEPPYVGSTFHHIISEPDAGDIIHQTVPKLEHSDGIHDVACKTIVESTKDAIKLLEIFNSRKTLESFKQKGSGKNFLENDFKPQHLRVIYNIFNNDMVKEYLNGKLQSKKPKLIRQF